MSDEEANDAVRDFIKDHLRQEHRERMLAGLPEVIESMGMGMTEIVTPEQVLAAFYIDHPEWAPPKVTRLAGSNSVNMLGDSPRQAGINHEGRANP